MRTLDLPSQVPAVGILFDDVRGTMLRWDGPLLEKLRARGARFPDFPARLDEYLAGADALPDSADSADAPLLKRFYFDSTPDSVRRARLKARLAKMEYGFEVSEAALSELAKEGFDPVYGARPLKRAIQGQIENPLAKAILEGRFAPKDTIKVGWKNGSMVFAKG